MKITAPDPEWIADPECVAGLEIIGYWLLLDVLRFSVIELQHFQLMLDAILNKKESPRKLTRDWSLTLAQLLHRNYLAIDRPKTDCPGHLICKLVTHNLLQ